MIALFENLRRLFSSSPEKTPKNQTQASVNFDELSRLTKTLASDQLFLETYSEPRVVEGLEVGGAELDVIVALGGREGSVPQSIELSVVGEPGVAQTNYLNAKLEKDGSLREIGMEGEFVDQIQFEMINTDAAKVARFELSRGIAGSKTRILAEVARDDIRQLNENIKPQVDYGPEILAVAYHQSEVGRSAPIDRIDISMHSWKPVDELTTGKNCSFYLHRQEDGKYKLFASPEKDRFEEPDIEIPRDYELIDKAGNELKISAYGSESGMVTLNIGFVQHLNEHSSATYDPLRESMYLSPFVIDSAISIARDAISGIVD